MSESIRLANELIDGTLTQKKIIAWKKKYKIFHKNPDDYGKVGISYWLNFMKRKGHLLKSKRGKKYAIDRSNFTSYLNL